jgi:uncharacterized protein
METVSYESRICSDQKKIENFLTEERVGIIGMAGNDYPYAVPVNYIFYKNSIIFHGMGTGKKNDLIFQNPFVCFTVYKEIGTVTAPVPCHVDTSYISVMIYGKVKEIKDPKAGAEVLQKLVEKYMPDFYEHALSENMIQKYRSETDGKAVSIYQIEIAEMTAKENIVGKNQLFKG